MMSNHLSPKKKTRESMVEALALNMPPEPEPLDKAIPQGPHPSVVQLVGDSEEDYEFARNNLKALLDKANEAIDSMMNLAKGCEHPRAFEVLGGLMRHASDITDQLMALQKDRRRLSADPGFSKTPTNGTENNTTTNTLFVGSVTQLQKFLVAQKNEAAVIDIDAEVIDDDD